MGSCEEPRGLPLTFLSLHQVLHCSWRQPLIAWPFAFPSLFLSEPLACTALLQTWQLQAVSPSHAQSVCAPELTQSVLHRPQA